MKAISIRQPFAALVAAGYKDVECRPWPTKYRGPLFILSVKQPPEKEEMQFAEGMCRSLGYDMPTNLEIGGIVGMAYLADCVEHSSSPWHEVGTYSFVLTQARPISFRPYRGIQKLFNIEGLDYLWDEYPPLAAKPRRSWLQRMKGQISRVMAHP